MSVNRKLSGGVDCFFLVSLIYEDSPSGNRYDCLFTCIPPFLLFSEHMYLLKCVCLLTPITEDQSLILESSGGMTKQPVPLTCPVLTASAFPYELHFAGLGKPPSDILVKVV